MLLLLPAFSGCDKERIPFGPGHPAPDFTLKDLSGKSVTLSDFKGKVVMVEFWATWCPPCVLAIPHLKKMHKKFDKEDFVLLAISIDSDLEKLKKFVAKRRIAYPVLFSDKKVERLFHVVNIPTTFLIDRQGNIAHQYMGFVPESAQYIEKDIESML